jgi:hypothetical protein
MDMQVHEPRYNPTACGVYHARAGDGFAGNPPVLYPNILYSIRPRGGVNNAPAFNT